MKNTISVCCCWIVSLTPMTLLAGTERWHPFRRARVRHFLEVKLSQHGSVGTKTNNRSKLCRVVVEEDAQHTVLLLSSCLFASSLFHGESNTRPGCVSDSRPQSVVVERLVALKTLRQTLTASLPQTRPIRLRNRPLSSYLTAE